MRDRNDDSCAISGRKGANVYVEADGTLEAGYGSRHDTIRFVWMVPPPSELIVGDRICDLVVDEWIAEGKIVAYESVRSGPIPVSPAVFKVAFAIERAKAAEVITKMLASEIPIHRALGRLLNADKTPDPFTLGLVDALVDGLMGRPAGVDELLEPWLEQRRLRNTFLPAILLGNAPEGDDEPLEGISIHVVERIPKGLKNDE